MYPGRCSDMQRFCHCPRQLPPSGDQKRSKQSLCLYNTYAMMCTLQTGCSREHVPRGCPIHSQNSPAQNACTRRETEAYCPFMPAARATAREDEVISYRKLNTLECGRHRFNLLPPSGRALGTHLHTVRVGQERHIFLRSLTLVVCM